MVGVGSGRVYGRVLGGGGSLGVTEEVPRESADIAYLRSQLGI